MIFISATGIAVRAIAPYLQDKMRDPAILAVDEMGRFVVPLLSGHVGGANRLARQVALLLNATPVISTATDLNHCFAVDEWAASNGMMIADRKTAKAISAALLAGQEVGFRSEFSHDSLPMGVTERDILPCFAVTCHRREQNPSGTLTLHPKVLAVGIGCKKELPVERVSDVVNWVLERNGLAIESVACLSSITLKRNDAGIRCLAEKWRVPSYFYSPEELAAVEGDFTPSPFVRSITGVDNVCERSACLASGGGHLLVKKTALSGVTVAVAQRDYFVRFEVEP